MVNDSVMLVIIILDVKTGCDGLSKSCYICDFTVISRLVVNSNNVYF